MTSKDIIINISTNTYRGNGGKLSIHLPNGDQLHIELNDETQLELIKKVMLADTSKLNLSAKF